MTRAGPAGEGAEWALLVARVRELAETLEATCHDLSTVGVALALPPIHRPTEPRDLAGLILLRAGLDQAASLARDACAEVTPPRASRRRRRFSAANAVFALDKAAPHIEHAAADIRDHPAIEAWFAQVAYALGTRLDTLLADCETLAIDLDTFGR